MPFAARHRDDPTPQMDPLPGLVVRREPRGVWLRVAAPGLSSEPAPGPAPGPSPEPVVDPA